MTNADDEILVVDALLDLGADAQWVQEHVVIDALLGHGVQPKAATSALKALMADGDVAARGCAENRRYKLRH